MAISLRLVWVSRIGSGEIFANRSMPSVTRARRLTGSGLYGMLRSVNVLATHDLLRLACEAGASFDFVSSLSVCDSSHGPRSIDESFDPLPHLEHLHFGYAHTKAVAEALVRQAGQRG